jgi:hypothetical protein
VYLFVFLAFQLTGLYMLWKIIGISKAPVRAKTLAFYCLAAVTLPNLSLGLQYTLPRYLTAFCAILVLAAFARANRSRPARLALVCALLCGIVFGLSPEMGLVFIPAALAVLIAQAREAGDRPISGFLALGAGIAALRLMLPAGMLRESRLFQRRRFLPGGAFGLHRSICGHGPDRGPARAIGTPPSGRPRAPIRPTYPRVLCSPSPCWLERSIAPMGATSFYGIGFFLFRFGAGLSDTLQSLLCGPVCGRLLRPGYLYRLLYLLRRADAAAPQGTP